MKYVKHIAGLLLMAMAAIDTSAQGVGFYLGGKKVEISEGDSAQFSDNGNGGLLVKVTKNGEVEVYEGNDMTFYGDIERYFLNINNVMHTKSSNNHSQFGYGSMMHIRDVLTADLFRTSSGYNWFRDWADNSSMGANSRIAAQIWNFYETAIAATNKLIGAIDENNANDTQREYLGVAYAFRAMHYLDVARMYEYLPSAATNGCSYTGQSLTNLTAPIITEKTTPEQLAQLTRATREEMWTFIQSDLDKAEAYLANYQRKSKLLPDLACVYGLQARLSMWVADYGTAARKARLAITQSGATPLSETEMLDIENGFNCTTPSSWMWGAQPREDDEVVISGVVNWPSWMCNENTYGYTSVGVPVCITPSLYNAIDQNDMRRKLFRVSDDYSEPHLATTNLMGLDRYASLKFRPYKGAYDDSSVGGQAAYPLMRVEEMYFIEAEAKAHSSVTDGVNLLNAFMSQYRVSDYNYSTDANEQDVIQEIVKQKRIELWGEGQAFFDYKRLDMSVDRTQDVDKQYIPNDQRLSSADYGRPAWMNIVFPLTSLMQYKWNLGGLNNPDPSGLYYEGGGFAQKPNRHYTVSFADGIVRELLNLTTPAEYITVNAYAMDTAEGFVLQEPFRQIADSTTGYTGAPLSIRVSGGEAYIPAQSLGFAVNGDSVMIESTQHGTYANQVVSFPRNSITLTYGHEVKVVNSTILTEVRMPECASFGYSVGYDLYPGSTSQSRVYSENGQLYFPAKVKRMNELDEVRLVCVQSSLVDSALNILKHDASYGVTCKDTGWVDIPMIGDQDEYTIVGVGLRNGCIAYSNTYITFKYPDYSCSVYYQDCQQDEETGNWNVKAYCSFGPHAEKGYVALVDKYDTEEDVKRKLKNGLLPSLVQVSLSNNMGHGEDVDVPYPSEYGEYKLAALSVVGQEAMNVELDKSNTIVECPQKTLSAKLVSALANEDSSMTWRIRYDASEFAGAYIALLPDSMLTGNVREHVLSATYMTKVTGTDTIAIDIPNPQEGEYFSLVIAGYDATGKICKDVIALRHQSAVEEVYAWTSLGTATFRDDAITYLYGQEACVAEAQMEECDQIPGYYRLVNPYGKDFPLNKEGMYDADNDYYLYIHAEDSAFVYILPQSTGATWSSHGTFWLADMAGYCINQGYTAESAKADGHGGKLADGVITWPTNGMVGGFNGTMQYYANGNGLYYIALPGVTVESTSAKKQEDEIHDASKTTVEKPLLLHTEYKFK